MRRVLPILRENLRYAVRATTQKEAVILSELQARPGAKCVIFCRTRMRTERLVRMLGCAGMASVCYHAGMEWEARMRAQRQFMTGEVAVMAATSAFGMGVDVPDIRLVIHDCMPSALMDFAQQSGRAGRDGQVADCILLLDPGDLEFHRRTLMAAAYAMDLPWPERRRKFAAAKRDMGRMLAWCMGGDCLSAGLSRAFGQKGKPCGTCSACLAKKTGQPLRRVKPPRLWAMEVGDLTVWALDQAQRDYLWKQGLSAHHLLSKRKLLAYAKIGSVPADCGLPAELVMLMQAVLQRVQRHLV